MLFSLLKHYLELYINDTGICDAIFISLTAGSESSIKQIMKKNRYYQLHHYDMMGHSHFSVQSQKIIWYAKKFYVLCFIHATQIKILLNLINTTKVWKTLSHKQPKGVKYFALIYYL